MSVNTPTGTLLVGSRETTVLDLADRPGDAGGIDAVATAVSELAEGLDAKKLADVARHHRSHAAETTTRTFRRSGSDAGTSATSWK